MHRRAAARCAARAAGFTDARHRRHRLATAAYIYFDKPLPLLQCRQVADNSMSLTKFLRLRDRNDMRLSDARWPFQLAIFILPAYAGDGRS